MMQRLRIALWIAVALAVLGASALLLGRGTLMPGEGSGQAAIGGPFVLTDQNGRSVTEATLKGKPSAVFFGFTQCPEVCPTTLSELSGALKDLGPDADRLNVVFVTIDPERDTVPLLKDYVGNFDPRIIALTGSPEAIERTARAFRVYYKKVPTSGSDYTMDHSTFTYLMDADWKYADLIGYGLPREKVLKKLKALLGAQS